MRRPDVRRVPVARTTTDGKSLRVVSLRSEATTRTSPRLHVPVGALLTFRTCKVDRMADTSVMQQNDSPVTSGFEQVGQARPAPLASYLQEKRDATPTARSETEKPEAEAPITTDRRSVRRRARKDRSPKRRARKSRSKQTLPAADSKRQARKPKRRARRGHQHPSGNGAASHAKSGSSTGVVCSRCGAPIEYPNESRCENCFADDSARWPGNDRSATLYF